MLLALFGFFDDNDQDDKQDQRHACRACGDIDHHHFLIVLRRRGALGQLDGGDDIGQNVVVVGLNVAAVAVEGQGDIFAVGDGLGAVLMNALGGDVIEDPHHIVADLVGRAGIIGAAGQRDRVVFHLGKLCKVVILVVAEAL